MNNTGGSLRQTRRCWLPDSLSRLGTSCPLSINGYQPESGQTPLDLRYPRTSIVISGPASELFDSLHQPAIDLDIQVIWEPFRDIEDQAEVGHQVLGVVELPLDMPMAEAVRLTRRSLRAIKYTMKQVGASPVDRRTGRRTQGRI
jgi:hypothetical protein